MARASIYALSILMPVLTMAAETSKVWTHKVIANAPYYNDGPQQMKPADGELAAGTKAAVLQESGSYAQVKSETGVTAYVSVDALEPVGKEKRAVKPRGKKRDRTSDEAAAAATATMAFAIELYRDASGESGNVFLSPLSISVALAMTSEGAKGETAAQMQKVLHLDLPEAERHQAFRALLDSLASAKRVQLSIANQLWAQHDYLLRPEFAEVLEQYYSAGLEGVDFRRPDEARQAINGWVSEKTEKKIEDLLPPGSLDSSARLVLTNAVYFNGEWQTPFDAADTNDEPFHVTPDSNASVPMMHKTARFRHLETNDLQVLEMPYKGDDLAMIIVLPKEQHGLATVEEQLSEQTLASWQTELDKSRPVQVEVSLPRFKSTDEIELSKTLTALGMKDAFDGNRADFSGISGNRELVLSAVFHKAYVDVNEKGTEAAAATGAIVGITSALGPPAVFKADHPFLYLIRDKQTGGILFLGRMANPTE